MTLRCGPVSSSAVLRIRANLTAGLKSRMYTALEFRLLTRIVPE